MLHSKIWLNCLVYERQITIGIPAMWNLFYVPKPTTLAAFTFITRPKHVCNELVKLNEIEFQEKIPVIDEAKRKVFDTFINTIIAISGRCQSKIPITDCF